MAYTTVELTEPDPLLGRVYERLLVPSFPPDELDSQAYLDSVLEAGTASLFAVLDAEGAPVATAVGEWSEASRVCLLSYLAVDPGARGTGIGGALLRRALEVWSARYDPCLVVAEIEDPSAPALNEAHGDPRRRLAFYESLGATVLDIPYFQPGIGGADRRVHGMLLLVLHADAGFTASDPGTIEGRPLRLFMEEYLEEAEGAVADDADTGRLFAAIDRPGGIRTGPWKA